MATEKNYRFGNIQVTKTRIESKSGITKFISISRLEGDCWTDLSPNDPDYKAALLMSINQDNE